MKPMIDICGCCEGIEVVTPLQTANRPGLSQLSYRVGTFATFLESMLARLSSKDYPKLSELKTREADDPAIAFMDAWAIVADVLIFYNERIINEGYLLTATERRSILELARLVGYKLRPGVASSVFLAYTLDDNFKDEVVIPKGARTQSIPGPNEIPQSFETSEELKARAQWNNLKPRLTRPQTELSIKVGNGTNARIYLKGVNTNLHSNDPLLIDYEGNNNPEKFIFDRVKEIKLEPEANRTLIILQSKAKNPDLAQKVHQDNNKGDIGIIEELTKPPSVHPDNSLKLRRDLQNQFGKQLDSNGLSSLGFRDSLTSGEASNTTLKSFAPMLKKTLAIAQANAQIVAPNTMKVYALRAKAGLFGHNYSGIPISLSTNSDNRSFVTVHIPVPIKQFWPIGLLDMKKVKTEGLMKLIIEPPNEKIQKEGWIVIERPELEIRRTESVSDFVRVMTEANSTGLTDLNGFIKSLRDQDCKVTGHTHTIHKVQDVQEINQQSQNPLVGITTKVNLLAIDKPWMAEDLTKIEEQFNCIALLKQTTVYTQSEELELAEEVIEEIVCGGSDQLIELDGFYEGLEAGRWVVVSGEREIAGTTGVKFSELAMLSSVRQDTRNIDTPDNLPGDKLHTFIELANELNYCFKRDTVTINTNVVKATHGETRRETLGSGDGAKALQSFALRQPPLTYIPAANPTGVNSTLKLYVNDIQWHETDMLPGLSPNDRNFITKTDDEAKTTLVFGNGREGARLPTGIENIKSEYRNGIGKIGNVKAGQISLLTTRPLGVKEVINPLPASGGADKESKDQARKNASLAIKALDRLVSVMDYEDFTRTYAGIGKARAVELSDGRRQLVHVTIAGSDDIPIDKNSDLYRNLRRSLLDFGEPYQAIRLELRELMFVVIQANIRILTDYLWEPVVTQVRFSLLDAFSFERRELGQDVLLSEVLGVMQAVRGVEFVDVDAFGGIPEKQFIVSKGRQLLTPDEIAKQVADFVSKQKNRPETRLKANLADFELGAKSFIHPAQLAFLTPEVPATLIINQIM